MEDAAILSVILLGVSVSGLSHDGCDDGWVALNHHCYYFGVLEGEITQADSSCQGLGSNLASLWGGEERDFVIDELWKEQVPRDGFAWYGLYGNSGNQWAWRDGSKFSSSHLQTSVSGSPDDKTSKCGALMGTGNYAFLDCGMDAQAYVCKKALPMVYTTSPVANVTQVTPHDHFQLFERLVPPRLSTLPPVSQLISRLEVASETGCAYYCFSLKACKGFQYACMTESLCVNYECKLFYNV